MCPMEIAQLGRLLRGRRTAAGRTIASVAADAGLSVPYIANLENGRGNPTLAAIAAVAGALGTRLVVAFDDVAVAARGEAWPDSLVQFARGPRFAAEADRLAAAGGTPVAAVGATPAPVTAIRERLLYAMAAMGSLSSRPLSELDWHRILDTVVLLTRE